MTRYILDEDTFKGLQRIEDYKEKYIHYMERRDWQSCDFIADCISIERAKLGITGLKHPLEEDTL